MSVTVTALATPGRVVLDFERLVFYLHATNTQDHHVLEIAETMSLWSVHAL